MAQISVTQIVVIGLSLAITLFFVAVVVSDQAYQRRLAKSGVPAVARVMSIKQTGGAVNNRPVVQITAEIHREDGAAPYVAEFSDAIPVQHLSEVHEGASLRARALPERPSAVGLVWPD